MEAVFHDGVREKDGKAGHNSQQFANAAAEECSGGGHPTIPKPFRSFIAQPSPLKFYKAFIQYGLCSQLKQD